MIVDLPVHEFRAELNELIDRRLVTVSFGDIEALIGPRIPFTGEVGSYDFRLSRNLQWFLRSSKYIEGTFKESNNRTEVTYELKTNMVWFVIIRIIFVAPFLYGFLSMLSIPALIFPLGAYAVIHFVDAWRAKRLENSFLMEMNMLPHNYKSRFKR